MKGLNLELHKWANLQLSAETKFNPILVACLWPHLDSVYVCGFSNQGSALPFKAMFTLERSAIVQSPHDHRLCNVNKLLLRCQSFLIEPHVGPGIIELFVFEHEHYAT